MSAKAFDEVYQPLPKVEFAWRVRQSPPVTSRERPDMYPALWRPGLGLRDDRGRKCPAVRVKTPEPSAEIRLSPRKTQFLPK